jgi:hypothetical protein
VAARTTPIVALLYGRAPDVVCYSVRHFRLTIPLTLLGILPGIVHALRLVATDQ